VTRWAAAGLLTLGLLAGCADGQAPVMGQAALGAVKLASSDGRTLAIRDLQGTPTLLFFGPAAEHLQVVFVTVDPQRDTPAHLREYLAAFDTTFLGLAGDEAGTRAIAESLGVSYRRVGEGDAATFEHTASWFLLGADGQLQDVYGYAMSEQAIVEKLRVRLAAAEG